MALARFSLYAVALGLVSVGAVFLIAPTILTTTADILLPVPVARMEIRGVYGGFFVGTGVFFLLCARRHAWLRPGLVAQASIMGGLVLGRGIGIVVDGAPSSYIVGLLAIELLALITAVVALKQLDRIVGIDGHVLSNSGAPMKLEVLSRVTSKKSGRPPLLFVHGSCHAAWCWDEHFLGWFAAAGFDTHAVSLRGHGGSEGSERLRWASVSDYVEDVRRVAAGLPRSPVLIGHSLGELVVQKYLEQYDARGAVLLAPSPVNGMFHSGLRLFRQNPVLFAKVHLTLEPGVLYATPDRVRRFLFSSHFSEESITRHADRLGRESFRAMLDMTYSLPRVDRIRGRGCPLLVLGAAEDVIVPPPEIEATACAYDAPFRIFPAMGHDMCC
jgi:pimeloyl-ACP methyl ester carboxylesterase